MNSDDILNLGNYAVGTTYLSDAKVTASVTDGGKAVLLNFKNAEKINLDDILEDSGNIEITVGRVRDAAGNYSNLSTPVVCKPFVGGITIESVEAVNKTTLVVKLSDALNKFDKDDFEVNVTTAGVTFENVDGKGVLTYTLADGVELDTTGTNVDYFQYEGETYYTKQKDNPAADLQPGEELTIKQYNASFVPGISYYGILRK